MNEQPPQPQETRPSLLVRLRDARDGQAWHEFVDIYSPLIYGFARKHGLQEADAVDVTQEVLQAVSKAIGRLDYDPARGSFRGWLFTIVRNEINTWFGRQRSPPVGIGQASTNVFDLLISDDDASAIWERDHEQRLFEWAAQRVRAEVQESTWKAFWLSTVENKDAKSIASELGLSVAAVYLSKSRVMTRLKELIRLASHSED